MISVRFPYRVFWSLLNKVNIFGYCCSKRACARGVEPEHSLVLYQCVRVAERGDRDSVCQQMLSQSDSKTVRSGVQTARTILSGSANRLVHLDAQLCVGLGFDLTLCIRAYLEMHA